MYDRPRIIRPHGTIRQPGLGRRALRSKVERRIRTGWIAPALAGAAVLGGVALAVRTKAREAERRHPPVGRFMTVDGVRLHFIDTGEGPPVILFHGNGSLIEEFLLSGLVDRLARNHRVIVFDRPGFGYSSRPRSRVWTPMAQAELFWRALDRLQVGAATVYGHSWGTLVAVSLALIRPSRVAGLVLGAGYFYPTSRLDVPLGSPPAMPVLGDVLRYTIAPAVSRLLLPRIYEKIFAPAPVPRSFAERFPHELVLRPWHLRAASAETALMIPATMKLQRHYRELEMPVAIVSGGGDRIVEPDRHSLRLHREIPHSTYAVLPGVGHMIHHVALDDVVEAVEAVGRPAAVRRPSSTTGFESRRSGAPIAGA
jgi:pimeloyl-ACP methyl ester carboxylesterase